MDRIVVVLGFVMIAMTAYVAFVSHPPVGAALRNAVLPERVDFLAITTLVGGTVGGYITYAGAHRLLDAGVRGPDRVAEISRASVIGVLVTGLMRVLLFLAVLGVVAAGVRLDPSNPAASAFEAAAGGVGRRVFGLILWAAAITSVIGASYTSVSFLVGASERLARRRNLLVVAFIGLSATVYLMAGAAPVPLLVFAGAFNGLILPLGIAVLLWVAARRPDLMGGYAYPRSPGGAGSRGVAGHDLPGLGVAGQAGDAVPLACGSDEPGSGSPTLATIDAPGAVDGYHPRAWRRHPSTQRPLKLPSPPVPTAGRGARSYAVPFIVAVTGHRDLVPDEIPDPPLARAATACSACATSTPAASSS